MFHLKKNVYGDRFVVQNVNVFSVYSLLITLLHCSFMCVYKIHLKCELLILVRYKQQNAQCYENARPRAKIEISMVEFCGKDDLHCIPLTLSGQCCPIKADSHMA
jgi:hypothetical protein